MLLRGLVLLFLITISAVALSPGALGRKDPISAQSQGRLLAQAPTPTPGYINWYYYDSPIPTPTPIPSAYAAILGAFAAGIVYNTGTGGSGSPNGLDIVNTGLCNFLCFGTRGVASSAVVLWGNDVDTVNNSSYTILGAPDDCGTQCPGGVKNSVYGITLSKNGSSTYLAAVDGSGSLGVYNNVIAGATIVAGGTPYPAPTVNGGSLISHTGAGTGELLLGGSTNFVRCDYGETTASVLTCNAPMTVTAPLMAAESASSSTGPVPPCYDHNGTACGSAFHIVKNASDPGVTTNGPCNANTWCSLNGSSITLSSAGGFTSMNYTCALSSSSTYQLSLTVNNQSTTGFTIQAYYPTTPAPTPTPIASGTNLEIQYACSGD